MVRTVKRGLERLSADDWTAAALEAVASGGLGAVAVEPLARKLGVTKGSFYAHFSDRDELIDAALHRWEQAHVEAFLADDAEQGDPLHRLEALMRMAISAARKGTIQGRLLLESDDPRVRSALQRVTEIRLLRLEAIFRDLRLPDGAAERRATLAYAIYIGLLQLAREVPERLADETALVGDLLELLAPLDATGARA
jgi:AcrR family transcriptional regulator